MFPETEFERKTRSFELTEFTEEDREKRAQFAKGAELRSALGKNILLSSRTLARRARSCFILATRRFCYGRSRR